MLRKVKYLYIDDDTGRIIADCEGGNVVLSAALDADKKVPDTMVPSHDDLIGVTASNHHTKTGDYEVYARTEEQKNMPPANPGHLGRLIRQRCGDGQPTTVSICVQASDDDYEWIQLGVSS